MSKSPKDEPTPKTNDAIFNSKEDHDKAEAVVAGESCPYDGREWSIGSEVCMGKLKMKCGKNGWYKIGSC